MRVLFFVLLISLCAFGGESFADSPRMPVGEQTRPHRGWVQFCGDNPQDCNVKSLLARNAKLTKKAWQELAQVNESVNEKIKAKTDLEHWGMDEKWSYPDDGFGDCEDYVLEKRRMLLRAGWPRQALLVTVVRDKKDEGHAVLTVKTDKGEFILDNEKSEILLWSETGYSFIKRQSQKDPNVWVSIGDLPAVGSTRR